MRKHAWWFALGLAPLVLTALIAGCDFSDVPLWMQSEVKPPQETGDLVVLTLHGPVVRADAQSESGTQETPVGFERDLASLLGKELGYRVRFRTLPSYARLIEALEKNRGHLAAAQLSPTPDLAKKFVFGLPYQNIQYQLVYRSADKKPRNMNDATGLKIAVIAETPAHDILRELTGTYPGLAIDVLPHESDAEDLLKEVDTKQAEFALVDTAAFSDLKRIHPDLAVAFNVGREAKVAWAFSPSSDEDLRKKAARFIEKIRANGMLNRLLDRYYGHVSRIQPIDSEAFLEKLTTVLPKLRPYFQEAQELTGLDWRLIAAMGYQESHWDALATSPTGVRGLMMLTDETADRMKIKNRLDARESILGGAQYFVLLRDTVPARIPEPDRTWLALAAYNQGYGHLEDARVLTQRMKLNADSWLDVRKAYLQMRDPAVFETLAHGYCRGDEAVSLVDAIRNYYDILLKLEKPLDRNASRESESLFAPSTLPTPAITPPAGGRRAQIGSASVTKGK